MSEQKQNSLSPHEQHVEPKKPTQDQAKLTTINLPSNFPFQDLMCHEEHKETFEGLLGENNLRH